MSLSIVIQVTHLLGSGHLTRAAALAEACAARGHDVTLISGGMPNALARRDGYHLVQLPPVRIEGAAFTRLMTPGTLCAEAETGSAGLRGTRPRTGGEPADETYLAVRREAVLATIADRKPDVLITELFPFGRRVLAGEFLAALDAARARPKPVTVLSSIRDILAAPSRPERVEEATARIAACYDGVLVHGDPALVPLDASWPVGATLRPFLHYTGYIDNTPASDMAPARGAPPAEIVVSGGFSPASLPLYRSAIAAAKEIGRSWHILVGNGVGQDDFAALAAGAPQNALIERARPDFRAVLAQAALSVSQCGYNTAIDVLGLPLRRLFVPFEDGGETEQLLRAETLAGRGLAAVLRESGLSPGALAATVAALLGAAPPPCPVIRLDGAATSAALIEDLHREARR